MIRQAVILAGGLGTRLGAITAQTPKPMVPVGGRPFLDYLLDTLGSQGFDDILLLTGYRGDAVADRYDGRQWRGATIRCVREEEPLGTAGALINAASHLHGAFLLMNGDTFFDINLRHLAGEALALDSIALLALRAAQGDRYGTVDWDGDRINSFAARGRDLHMNGGIYILQKSILEGITQLPASLETDIFPALAKDGRLHGRAFDRFFIDIGIPEALAEAQASVPAQTTRPAVFFDRDGVLNQDTGYVHKPEDFIWREGAIDTIRMLNDAGWWVIVVTNQAGVARGYYPEKDIHALHDWMNEILAGHGAHINAFYHCPHHPEGEVAAYAQSCLCRKPEAGMLKKAMAEWPIDPDRSFLVGDKDSDIAAATKAGIGAAFIEDEDALLTIVADRMLRAG